MAETEGYPFPKIVDVAARFRTRPTAWGALAVNLVPIAGVLFFGWNAAALMMLYWLENVTIGVGNVLRMGASGLSRGRTGALSLLFLIPFFIMHYGIFCLVHGVFVFVMFGSGLTGMHTLNNINSPLDMPVLIQAMLKLQPTIASGLAAIIIWQALQFVFFLAGGAYKRTDPFTQMMAPYGRVIILHITLMGAGLIVFLLGQPLIGVVLLALLKTVFDVGIETRAAEEKKTAENWGRFETALRSGFKPEPGSTPPE